MTCIVVGTTSASAQDLSLLTKPVPSAARYTGSTDSLLHLVERETGVSISFSNQTFLRRQTAVKSSSPTLQECLDAIFLRFAPRYIPAQNNKILVLTPISKLVTVSGYCRDAQNGEALIGTNVVDTFLRRGNSTNADGYYCLHLPPGNAVLRFSFVGYSPRVLTIPLTADTIVTVEMSDQTQLLDIDVDAHNQFISDDEREGTTTLPPDLVRAMPTLLGESDAISTLRQTPGTQSGSEGFGGMSVRGGGIDQNMIFIDDAPLYSPNHLLGIFSAFNTDIINKVSLIKSGFPSRYGGRLSSVLDIRMRDGDLKHYGASANIGLLASTLTADGPIVKDKVSFVVSARRSYFDFVPRLLNKGAETQYSYYFYDAAAKVNWRINSNNTLSATVFNGGDKLRQDFNIDKSQSNYIRWGNTLASTRWSHVFAPPITLNIIGWLSRYRFRNYKGESDYQISNEYRNEIHDYGLRADLAFYPSIIPCIIRVGSWQSVKNYRPLFAVNTRQVVDTVYNNRRLRETDMLRSESHAYAEMEFRHAGLYTSMGLHLSSMPREEQSTYRVWEPRLLAGYKFSPYLTVRAGYSLTSQFAYLFRLLSVSLPSDIWLPIPAHTRPQRARQFSVSLHSRLPFDLSLSVEAYHKKYINILTQISMSPYEIISRNRWSETCTEGVGDANGIEIMLRRNRGNVRGWVGYTLSRSRNKYELINDGEYFPQDNDRRHALSVFATYSITERTTVSASWNYATGAPFTLHSQRYSVVGYDATFSVPEQRNFLRMPSQHSLNIGVDIRFPDSRFSKTLSLGVYNTYAHANPMFIYWRPTNDGKTYSLKQFSLVGIPLPYFKYSIHF
ncbi:MAG: TonB-dependent receptor [Bacteroidales bacterium]|nr:TonB-dependent receptor [Bacteroidales bacterium]